MPNVDDLLRRIDRAERVLNAREAKLNDELHAVQQQRDRLKKSHEYLHHVWWAELDTKFLDELPAE